MKEIRKFNRAESFTDQGFRMKVLSVQEFNVLCVSKYSMDNEFFDYHVPTDGYRGSKAGTVKIQVKAVKFTRGDVSVTQTIVTFNGKNYLLESTRNGLSGQALVIGIFKDDDDRWGVWHLYTDTPSAKPDHKEITTSKQLRKRAAEAMGWSPNCNAIRTVGGLKNA